MSFLWRQFRPRQNHGSSLQDNIATADYASRYGGASLYSIGVHCLGAKTGRLEPDRLHAAALQLSTPKPKLSSSTYGIQLLDPTRFSAHFIILLAACISCLNTGLRKDRQNKAVGPHETCGCHNASSAYRSRNQEKITISCYQYTLRRPN